MKNMMKKDVLFLMLSLLLGICVTGCTERKQAESEANVNKFEHIGQDQAKGMMDTKTDYIILDVRTIEEYNEGHIKGAICIPNETIGNIAPEELPDKNQLIFVYCRSGNRSDQAAKKLAALGYTQIKEFGGITTWEYETE